MNATNPLLPSMRKERYTIRFLTPAFLGDAEQDARWRTPPFKHLLREWWRVAWIEAMSFRPGADAVEALRKAEGRLFGNAWIQDDFRKSEIRLRLSHWRVGALKAKDWPADLGVQHPEVGQGGRSVGSVLYMGYGPLMCDQACRRGTALKKRAAIQADESAELSMAWPAGESPLIERAIALAGCYGAVGGRSRNAWGSFTLEAVRQAVPPPVQPPIRPWTDCFDRDWPHAIGSDQGGPLIWQTGPHKDWAALMRELARTKIGLRTHLGFAGGDNAPQAEPRHWLAYPVTNHRVAAWNGFRLPNQLRFRARLASDGKKLVGVIFHMPHLPPAAFAPNPEEIMALWVRVHQWLDGNLERSDG